jgi:hypothetical protein
MRLERPTRGLDQDSLAIRAAAARGYAKICGERAGSQHGLPCTPAAFPPSRLAPSTIPREISWSKNSHRSLSKQIWDNHEADLP